MKKGKKELILLIDLDDNNVDYIFNIKKEDLEKAIDFRNEIRNNPEYDNYCDFDLIQNYLERNNINYDYVCKPTKLYY